MLRRPLPSQLRQIFRRATCACNNFGDVADLAFTNKIGEPGLDETLAELLIPARRAEA